MYRVFVFLLFLSVFIFPSDGPFADTNGDKKTGAQSAVLSLLLSDAAAQSTCIKLYDANDQELGILLSNDEKYAEIFIPALGLTTGIEKRRGRISSTYRNFDPIFFDDDNCEGNAYFTSLSERDFLLGTLFQTAKGYSSLSHEQVKNVDIKSQLDYGICSPYVFSTSAYPIVPVSAEDIPFKLPAKVPLQIKLQ